MFNKKIFLYIFLLLVLINYVAAPALNDSTICQKSSCEVSSVQKIAMASKDIEATSVSGAVIEGESVWHYYDKVAFMNITPANIENSEAVTINFINLTKVKNLIAQIVFENNNGYLNRAYAPSTAIKTQQETINNKTGEKEVQIILGDSLVVYDEKSQVYSVSFDSNELLTIYPQARTGKVKYNVTIINAETNEIFLIIDPTVEVPVGNGNFSIINTGSAGPSGGSVSYANNNLSVTTNGGGGDYGYYATWTNKNYTISPSGGTMLDLQVVPQLASDPVVAVCFLTNWDLSANVSQGTGYNRCGSGIASGTATNDISIVYTNWADPSIGYQNNSYKGFTTFKQGYTNTGKAQHWIIWMNYTHWNATINLTEGGAVTFPTTKIPDNIKMSSGGKFGFSSGGTGAVTTIFGNVQIYNVTSPLPYVLSNWTIFSLINIFNGSTVNNYNITVFNSSIRAFNTTNVIGSVTLPLGVGNVSTLMNVTANYSGLVKNLATTINLSITDGSLYMWQSKFNITDTANGRPLNPTCTIAGQSLPFSTNYSYTTFDNVNQIVTLACSQSGYANLNQQINLTLGTPLNITMRSVMINFTLFDEKTGNIFNVSSADSIYFQAICPEQTQSTLITSNISAINVSCNWIKFRFVLNYGATSYYRSLIYDYNQSSNFNFSVYLINLATTNALSTTFVTDDLLNQYKDLRVYVYEVIGGSMVQITADWVDISQKVSTYLITNNEYDIQVVSSNKPLLDLGSYFAATAGDQTIRLYDIAVLSPGASSFSKNTRFMTYADGVNGNFTAYALYNDSSTGTSSVMWTLYEGSSSGPVIYTNTYPSSFVATYNISAYNQSSAVVSVMNITSVELDNTPYVYGKIISTYVNRHIPIMNWVSPAALNWFILLLLSCLAIFATAKTSNPAAFAVIGFGVLFMILGWFGISAAVMAVVTLFSFINWLARGTEQQ